MNNSKKGLRTEIESKFYIKDILEVYNIAIDKIVDKYQEKRRSKDICSFSLECIENALKKQSDFVGRIDFLYNPSKGEDGIGEISYYTDKKEYKSEVNDSYDCGRPISCKILKNNEIQKGFQIERSLN